MLLLVFSFSLLLIYTKGLWAPVVAHFVWNFAGGILVSGVVLANDYPSFYKVSLHGNAIMSGGSTKIEGGIVVLLLNLILIGVVGYLLKKRPVPAA